MEREIYAEQNLKLVSRELNICPILCHFFLNIELTCIFVSCDYLVLNDHSSARKGNFCC